MALILRTHGGWSVECTPSTCTPRRRSRTTRGLASLSSLKSVIHQLDTVQRRQIPWVLSLCVLAAGGDAAGKVPLPSKEVMDAFEAAFAAQGDYEAMEKAWTHAIDVAPDNPAAWSNRGTARLQYGRWQGAHDDLQHARDLEDKLYGGANSLLLNNLGNAAGALGQWEEAKQLYQEASGDPAMEAIARANLALAAFQVGDADSAIKEARQLLRRDPDFLDMRAALVGFLWSEGQDDQAEDMWEQLQDAQGGLGGAIYSRAMAVERVRSRWPPRATAALRAFLMVADEGSAEDYDGSRRSFAFPRV